MTAYSLSLPGFSGLCSFKLNLDAENPSEKAIMDFASNGNAYEPDVCHIFLKTLRPGDIALDIGANVGFFTILAANLVGSEGRIIAFEPDPANIEKLRQNIALNQLNNVVIIDKPVNDKVELVDFFFNQDSNGGNALWNPALFPTNSISKASPRCEKMETTTIDIEMARLGLNGARLIKIDTEGAEEKVLKGAENLLRSQNVPFIVSELHDFGLETMKSSQESLRKLMLDMGYFTFALYYSGVLPKLIHPLTKLDGKFILNVLFAHPEKIAALWPIEHHDPTT